MLKYLEPIGQNWQDKMCDTLNHFDGSNEMNILKAYTFFLPHALLTFIHRWYPLISSDDYGQYQIGKND